MTVKDAKGTLQIWVRDGAMSKMQVHLTGTRTFNDQDQPVDQTSTTEIKDVGTTKITVPDEAKKKLEMAKPGDSAILLAMNDRGADLRRSRGRSSCRESF